MEVSKKRIRSSVFKGKIAESVYFKTFIFSPLFKNILAILLQDEALVSIIRSKHHRLIVDGLKCKGSEF